MSRRNKAQETDEEAGAHFDWRVVLGAERATRAKFICSTWRACLMTTVRARPRNH